MPETTLAACAAELRRRVRAGEDMDTLAGAMQRETGFDRYKIQDAAFPASERAWRDAIAEATPPEVWEGYRDAGYSRPAALDEEVGYGE